MSNWVQHKSGDGEKWEIVDDASRTIYEHEWIVWAKQSPRTYYFLPRSEYVTCGPPDEWEDVTEKVDYCSNLAFAHRGGGRFGDEIVTDDKGYRFRKIDGLHNGPAFIVERKKS